MESFLAASKMYLANLDAFPKVQVVLGNQTCDLDSSVCALVQGYFLYSVVKEESCDAIAVIPVMNISEKELRVKTEVVYYLKRHSVPLNLLTFRDQINLDALNREGRLETILVDHHALADEDATLASSVVEIIDHRPEDPRWSWPGRAINLQTVGSCATLVAKSVLEKRPDIVDSQVSNLLRGAILIDTCNFSKIADRATPTDLEAIRSLEESDRGAVYRDILAAKADINGLTLDDLMIRDFKLAGTVPIVGFPMLVENFIKIDGAYEAASAFARERACSLVILMGLDLTNDVVTRDIAVFSLSSNELENKIIRALTIGVNPGLELTESMRTSREGCHFILYRQGNARASRKQILPIVRSASLQAARRG